MEAVVVAAVEERAAADLKDEVLDLRIGPVGWVKSSGKADSPVAQTIETELAGGRGEMGEGDLEGAGQCVGSREGVLSLPLFFFFDDSMTASADDCGAGGKLATKLWGEVALRPADATEVERTTTTTIEDWSVMRTKSRVNVGGSSIGQRERERRRGSSSLSSLARESLVRDAIVTSIGTGMLASESFRCY